MVNRGALLNTAAEVARWLPREAVNADELRIGDVLVLGRNGLYVVQNIEHKTDHVILTHSLNCQVRYSRADWATGRFRILSRAIPWLEQPADE